MDGVMGKVSGTKHGINLPTLTLPKPARLQASRQEHRKLRPVPRHVNFATEQVTATEAWDEAFLRVESYLHAHQITSRQLLTSLTSSVIEEARRRAELQPDQPPVAVAMAVLHERMAEWFKHVFEDGNWDEEQYRARGRLALLMTDMAQSWAPQFLASDQPPRELADRLNDVALQAGPELRLSKMPPAVIDFTIGDEDEDSITAGRWAALVPTLVVALLVLGAIGAALASTH